MSKGNVAAPVQSLQPAQTTVPTTPARPIQERRVVAWIGTSVLFRGDLTSLEDMWIDGRVEGTIELANHALTVGPDAHLQADITANAVHIYGHVVGTITATGSVDIGAAASVEGDIVARTVAIRDGAVVRGRIETGQRRDADATQPIGSDTNAVRG